MQQPWRNPEEARRKEKGAFKEHQIHKSSITKPEIF